MCVCVYSNILLKHLQNTPFLLKTDEFNGLWESLVYDEDIKDKVEPKLNMVELCFGVHFLTTPFQLLNYATTTLLFSDK